jgi:hypothetical protein
LKKDRRLTKPNDLDRVEALLDAFIIRMGGGSRATAARIIGTLDRDRRERERAKRDKGFVARTRVGQERVKDITVLLEQTGWSLRELVDRKLPLVRLEAGLKELVRLGKLEPSKALLLNRVKNRGKRADLLEQVRGGMTLKGLSKAIYGGSSEVVESTLSQDLAWLSQEATRTLGTRVVVREKSVTVEFFTSDQVTDFLEGLGVQL